MVIRKINSQPLKVSTKLTKWEALESTDSMIRSVISLTFSFIDSHDLLIKIYILI